MEKNHYSSLSPSTPVTDEPNFSDDEEGKSLVVKTPEEVLADLTANDDEITIGGGAVVLGSIGAMGGAIVGPVKMRKPSEFRDPPSGTPTCPICNRTFPSWKGAFGHMRKHPDRRYRGFFKPPNFSSSFSAPQPTTAAANAGCNNKASGGEGGSAALVRNLIDLNHEPLEGETVEEGQILGFDLNKPAADDDNKKP